MIHPHTWRQRVCFLHQSGGKGLPRGQRVRHGPSRQHAPWSGEKNKCYSNKPRNEAVLDLSNNSCQEEGWALCWLLPSVRDAEAARASPRPPSRFEVVTKGSKEETMGSGMSHTCSKSRLCPSRWAKRGTRKTQIIKTS